MLPQVLDGPGDAAAEDRALTERQLRHAFLQKPLGLGIGDKCQERRPADRQLA